MAKTPICDKCRKPMKNAGTVLRHNDGDPKTGHDVTIYACPKCGSVKEIIRNKQT